MNNIEKNEDIDIDVITTIQINDEIIRNIIENKENNIFILIKLEYILFKITQLKKEVKRIKHESIYFI